MSTPLMVVIVVVMFIVGVVGVIAVVLMTDKQKKNPKLAEQQRNLQVEKSFKWLYDFFLTRSVFRRVADQIAQLSIYSVEEVHSLSVKYFGMSAGASVCVIMVGAIAFRDIIAVLLCCVFAMVMFNVMVMKRIDDTHYEVVKEFSSVLASIRETYTIVGNIPDAIADCHTGKLLPKAMDRIYLVLTATDAEDRLEEFYRTVPFPMLQTLAGVCYILNDAGDEVNERGMSAFKNAITLLKNECDLEVRKLLQQRMSFSFLEYLPLIPLPFVGVLKWFLITYMPGTAVVFNGIIGYISQTLIILSALFAYWYITNATSPNAVRHDDRSGLVDKFLYWKPFNKHVLPNLLPKKAKTKAKIDKELQGALSHKDVNYIYASKVLAAVVAFITTIFFLISFTAFAREFTYNNIQSASFLSTTDGMTVREAELWHQLDAEVLAKPFPPNSSTLVKNGFIKQYFPDLSDMDIQEQANRIISKYNQYHSLRWHWWYILIAYAIATFAWFAPGIMLDLRKKLVQSEEEEDVLQLQTMLAILRYTSLDTMQALWWLSRQSQIHKLAITYAYHEYPSDPELAIERLRDKSNLPEFKQICERLLSTISNVTIREAFSDLEAERDHMLRIREMVQQQAIQKKRRQCSPISRAPLMIMVVGHFLVPIIVLAYNEVMALAPQLGF